MKDKIEFYFKDSLFAHCETSMIPTIGSFISIRGASYEVINVTFALDWADDPHRKLMRCNVDLKLMD